LLLACGRATFSATLEIACEQPVKVDVIFLGEASDLKVLHFFALHNGKVGAPAKMHPSAFRARQCFDSRAGHNPPRSRAVSSARVFKPTDIIS